MKDEKLMKKNSFSGSVMLLVAALLWGTTFVAQGEAMDAMEPFTFLAARSFLGGFFLIPVVFIFDKIGKRKKPDAAEKKKTAGVGALCGIILFLASILQQYGIALGTSDGKAGFITALYILLVPVVGLFMKKKVPLKHWLCIALAILGIRFICVKEDIGILPSDLLVLLCAFVYTLHIVAIDTFSGDIDGIRLSCIQFFICGIISAVCMFIFEEPKLSQITAGWFPIAYAGILSSGIAYTLQILGQQRTEPAIASLLMSFESVFAVIGSIVFGALTGAPKLPTRNEWIGFAMMFTAIILAEMPQRKKV